MTMRVLSGTFRTNVRPRTSSTWLLPFWSSLLSRYSFRHLVHLLLEHVWVCFHDGWHEKAFQNGTTRFTVMNPRHSDGRFDCLELTQQVTLLVSVRYLKRPQSNRCLFQTTRKLVATRWTSSISSSVVAIRIWCLRKLMLLGPLFNTHDGNMHSSLQLCRTIGYIM